VDSKINNLKKAEKLSIERNEVVLDIEKAGFEVPNSKTTNIKATIKPTIEIKGRNFFCLLNIKSNTTSATRVNAKVISGYIA
jgi:hypothetical protein